MSWPEKTTGITIPAVWFSARVPLLARLQHSNPLFDSSPWHFGISLLIFPCHETLRFNVGYACNLAFLYSILACLHLFNWFSLCALWPRLLQFDSHASIFSILFPSAFLTHKSCVQSSPVALSISFISCFHIYFHINWYHLFTINF